MTAWRIALRLLRRDWRAGELSLLAAALILTVAATAAVGLFAERVERAMARQGNELIAADLALESSTALSETFRDEARARGLRTALWVDFRSMATGAAGPRLAQVKAADADYPLRGRLRIRDEAAAPEREVAAGPPPGDIWVETRLLYLLGARVGDTIGLGESRLRIGAILSQEPDRGGGFIALAPRLLMNRADLAATGLIGAASRATWRLLAAGEARAVADFRDWSAGRLPPNARTILGQDANEEFTAAIERAASFLRLATLVTLLVAGAAIALASHRLVERQLDAVAVMRCLGAPRQLLLRVFLARLLLFGLAASLAGAALGWLAQQGLAWLLADWFEGMLPPAGPAPLAVGLATGLIALLGFAAPPLFQLAQVSPLRTLRRDLGAPRASATLTLLAAGLALALLIFWQSADPALAWRVLAGVLAALLALAVLVLGLVRLAGAMAGRARGVWRLGLAALARRPTSAVLQIAGFGIGILALLLLAVVRVDLLERWRASLPAGAPNQFLINIQPPEVAPLDEFLRARGIAVTELFPMIRARLIRIGDRAVDPDAYADPRASSLAAHEFNLSHGVRLQPDNRIVAGAWWPDREAPPQFSVERDLAATLGIRLGDTLTFWISGREVSAPVTSLREVQWDSFNVNFFVIASPALLGREPATHITSFHLPRGRESIVPELTRRFPGLTLLDVEAILAQVRQVIERGALAVNYVFLFTLLAGLLVMYAGIQASLSARRREHGVLRTLGVGRRTLLFSLAVEFAALGLIAGLLASVFAELTGWLLAERLFGLDFVFNPRLWALGVFGSALAIGLAGVLATWPLLIRPPLQALREGG